MKTKLLMISMVLLFAKNSVAQSINKWGGVINNPKLANGFVILEKSPEVKTWQANIIKRSYNDTSHSDEVVHKEVFNGLNSYFIPTKYREDLSTHEYLYEILGYSESGTVVYDTGIQPTIGDGTPMILRKTWECDGFDYAYKIELYSLPDGGSGVISVVGPGYVYEYLRPEDLPCGLPQDHPSYINFNIAHNLTSGWCSELGSFSPQVYEITNNDPSTGVNYYDRFGYLIYTSNVYAVQKANWKWPSGSIYVDNISNVDDLIGANLDFIIDWINTHSNIALVSPLHPQLECFRYDPLGPIDEDSESEFDCIMDGIAALVASPSFTISYEGNYLGIMEITNNCYQTGGNSYLDALDIIDISDINNPVQVVSLGKDEFLDENGEFTIPNFTIDKGTHWVSGSYSDGRKINFFMHTNKKTLNTLNEAIFVNFAIAPVPIQGDHYTLIGNSSISTSAIYEVYNNAGEVIYKAELKLSPNETLKVPIQITPTIPTGNVIHRFVFEDGSIKTINTIK